MIFGAVKGGHIEMLEWIKVNISPLIWEDERLKRFQCGIVAARNKHLQLLQWLQNNGFKSIIEHIPKQLPSVEAWKFYVICGVWILLVLGLFKFAP